VADALFGIGLFLGISVFVVLLLAARDARAQRRREERRPIAEQIAEIRAGASFMAQQLQTTLAQHAAERPKLVAWIPPVVDYYRRLETLASLPSPPLVEVHQLAEEAARHVRERRLKGICVGHEARRLAQLVERRGIA
jgi:hypothetical protein